MEVKKIVVVGSGIMGSGIAQIAAQAGYQVAITDIEQKYLDSGLASINKSLGIMQSKGKISAEQVAEIQSRIKSTMDMKEAIKDADYVIEAAPENIELKKNIFKNLDEICDKHTILATNTSTLSISTIARATKRPEKVIGTHFANPPQVMQGLEVILGADTSNDTLQVTQEVAKRMGKDPHFCKDYPGFIGSRLLFTFINEAFWELFEGIASPEHIDQHCKQQFRHPMGPLELADFIGLDSLTAGGEYLFRELGDRFRPCPLMKQKVLAGHLGRKVGHGVYKYDSNGNRVDTDSERK
jgi:3-hydroxybutyryl-CoA dehydrogenase